MKSLWRLSKIGESAILENELGLFMLVERWNNEDGNKGKWHVSSDKEEQFLPGELTFKAALDAAWFTLKEYVCTWLRLQPESIPVEKEPELKIPVFEFEEYEYRGCTQWGDKRRTTARVYLNYTHDGIFWNSECNTYVLVKPPGDMTEWQKKHLLWPNGLALCSINGVGEIRWDVQPRYYQRGDLEAIKYFGLDKLLTSAPEQAV